MINSSGKTSFMAGIILRCGIWSPGTNCLMSPVDWITVFHQLARNGCQGICVCVCVYVYNIYVCIYFIYHIYSQETQFSEGDGYTINYKITYENLWQYTQIEVLLALFTVLAFPHFYYVERSGQEINWMM